MIQRNLVFCIDNNMDFVSGSIPATKLTANDINRDVIYVVAPFEISSVVKVKFADELNQQENVSQLLKYTNEVSVDELVEKTKPYYETVKDWNVYYIEMNGKPLSFVSNRIASGIYISFSVVITKPKTNLVNGLSFVGYEYETSLDTPLNNGEYKIIRNPLFEEDGVSYKVDDIIYKENDNYFKISASIRKGGTTSVKYLVEPNIEAIDESLDPTLTEQIIGMVTDLEQNVANVERNSILKDGSVAMEDDLNINDNNIRSVNIIEVDEIKVSTGSSIDVVADLNINDNDVAGVNNIEVNGISAKNGIEIDIKNHIDMNGYDIKDVEHIDADTVYVKEIRSRVLGEDIQIISPVYMNGDGIYGADVVEGNDGIFGSLSKGGKDVATEEYVDGRISGVFRPSGNWNANTNTPTLVNNEPTNAGKVYYVTDAGTQFGLTFAVGDKLAFIEGGVATKWDNVDDVVSVNSKVGAVQLNADDIPFNGSGTNYLTAETEVEGAIKELDTRVKNELDNVKNGKTIEEKAIKPFQTSFLELGKNIFNKDTVIDGYRVVTTHGNLVATTGYTASQFIEVKKNTEYAWNLNTTNDTICFYDENKTYISSSGIYGVTNFTTPINCYFIRVSFQTVRFGIEQKTIAQIELGDTPTAYEPYFEYKIDGTKLNTNSVNVSSLDNELKQILIKSNEIYGFNFDFNGSLLRNPIMSSWEYNVNRFEIRRNSVAYDNNGNEIEPNLPVYRNVDFRRKGITQMEATTNLLTEANSISFSTPETISLNSGTYTLSFNKGNGSISISGYPDVTLNNPLTFTLSSTTSILLTPSGVVEMAQLEMKPYSTYWQKGGIPRVGSSTRIFLDEPINTEFGIGVRMQMNQDSTVIPTGSDENWRILHIYKDADNFIEVNLRPSLQYLVFTYRVNGVTTQIINYNVTYKKDEPFEVYIHVIPNNSIFIYYTKNGVLHQKFKADSIAIPPNFTQVALAHRLVLPTQDSNINNSIITNFKLERGMNCNPQKYFKEVLL